MRTRGSLAARVGEVTSVAVGGVVLAVSRMAVAVGGVVAAVVIGLGMGTGCSTARLADTSPPPAGATFGQADDGASGSDHLPVYFDLRLQ